MPNPKSAAASLYPHLQSGTLELVPRRNSDSAAAVMWPALSRRAKAEEQAYARNKQRLLEGLRELHASLVRERRR